MSKYNTNLASEFHVLPMLHRLRMKQGGQTYTFDKIVIKLPGLYEMKGFVGVTDKEPGRRF